MHMRRQQSAAVCVRLSANIQFVTLESQVYEICLKNSSQTCRIRADCYIHTPKYLLHSSFNEANFSEFSRVSPSCDVM